MSMAGFEPATPVNKRTQTHALDDTATVMGKTPHSVKYYHNLCIHYTLI